MKNTTDINDKPRPISAITAVVREQKTDVRSWRGQVDWFLAALTGAAVAAVGTLAWVLYAVRP